METNRLELYWPHIQPKALKRWDKLSSSDFESVAGNFDNFVEVIRRAYHPGRSKLTVEGYIRDWLFAELDALEFEHPNSND